MPAAQPPPGNPFTPMRVVPPERFVGRRRELAELWAGLTNMQSFSLVGEARIGKTSLLRYLEARMAGQLSEEGRYLPIYISMDAQSDKGSFCRAALERLLPHLVVPDAQRNTLRALEQRVEQDQPATIKDLERALGWAAAAGLRVVLLLDEFKDLLVRPAEFDDAFRGALRGLYTTGTAALVLVTRQRMREIDGLDSYFVNAVTTIELGDMLGHEAEELIGQPSDRPFAEEEARLALDAGRRHPLRLQWAGYLLYEWRGQVHSPAYRAPGILSDQAAAMLGREVQRRYDEAMEASAPRRRRRSWLSWLDAIGRAPMQTGDAIDTYQARIFGVVFLTMLFAVVGLFLACAFGVISVEQLGQLLRQIRGGE